MEPDFLDELDEDVKLYKRAQDFVAKGDYIKALQMTEDFILAHREDKKSWGVRYGQGAIFFELAERAENPNAKFAYALASVECFAERNMLSGKCAYSLQYLARHLGSVLYYKKSVEKAKQALSFAPAVQLSSLDHELVHGKKRCLEILIKDAEYNIFVSETSSIKNCEASVWESKKSPAPVENEYKGLRSYWVGLDIKIKREFMKVSIAKLKRFVEGVHERKGRDILEEVLTSAREDRKWTFWMCRSLCSKKFSTAEECKNHLEQEHGAGFKPSFEDDMVKRIGKDWSRKILVGDWEPVDAVAAVEMIKNRPADVEAFTSKSKKNGWSKEWPLAVDEERSKLLNEIKLLLLSLCDHKILSCSIRDWLMGFSLEDIGKLGVSEQSLIDSHLLESPQSICFLECHGLCHIRDFLKNIKCERNDGTDLVCRAVDSLLGRTRVKEKIDFDPLFSFVLLDKRLLKSNNVQSDDEGMINLFDPNVHYAKAPAQGDNFISWLLDYASVDKSFPKPIREHNLDMWMAVLRAVQYTCRALETKYEKKVQVLHYHAALTSIDNLCMSEGERRRNLQEDQWNRYASLLCNSCEERVPGNSLATKLFLCAARDVLDVFQGASHPTFDFTYSEDCLNFIREGKSLGDDMVLMSIDLLKSVVTKKVLLIDSKILLIDNSRIRLLENLTRISVFDNRSYMLQLLKPFLLNEFVNMESKARSDAAEADLLLEEEKKSQAKKKKKKNIKIISTSMSSPLDTSNKTVKHEHSVNLEPEGTSPSQKTMGEDSMEPEDTLASKKDRLEISSNIDNQKDTTEVDCGYVQEMPGEDALLEHLESSIGGAAVRYNSALDMTLKALITINVLKEDLKHNEHNHLDEQIPCALQNLFTAVVSKEIKTEGVYNVLLRDLLTSLDEFLSMSSDAAEILVTILEFWPRWKNSERESLVTRLFMLEEYERMSCRKCRRKANYSEKNSYGIVMAADSIRELKCALGNIKFVDILKVVRMKYQMLCDIKTGGCGNKNFVHHIISRCPPIFTIVLEWEKCETEKEISETTKALDLVIDISRLFKGLQPNTNYRLVSMVGCDDEKEHICIAYEKKLWINLRRESITGDVIGNWKSVIRFCGERNVRPEILFYEACSICSIKQ